MISRILFLLALLCGISAYSKNDTLTTIVFETTVHDFGEVKINQRISYDYEYTNTGKKPLLIHSVMATCGCTTPLWSRDPVAPGKKGKITVGFECFPIEMKFDKSLTVYCNTPEGSVVLTIKGSCVDKFKTLKEQYPVEAGRFRFDNNHAAFDKVFSNETNKQRFLGFYNSSEDTINILEFITPPYITCKAFPTYVKPHQEGKIHVFYDGTRNPDFGFKFDKVTMITDDKDAARKMLYISSELMEYFDTSVVNNAEITLPETNFAFGKVVPGAVKSHTFVIKNTGTDTLIIRKVRTTCGCTVVLLENDRIPPGKSTHLKVEYNTSGAVKGVNNKPLMIISTDRKKPVVNIVVSAEVE